MPGPEILDQRARESNVRLTELRDRVATEASGAAPTGLTVFCAGSYARAEASEHSDIDLFFVYGPGADGVGKRTQEIELFASLIRIVKSMEFPKFSNDGQYLTTMTAGEVDEHLGSPLDDAKNLFTLRMLMLLESKCIHGDSTFAEIQRSIIESYYRDYPDHQSTFEPWFLLNDIGRFWKTLLLNYENKRNQRLADTQIDSVDLEAMKNRQKVKNFKLKYSRMTTCFATIGALASYDSAVSQEEVFDLIQLTPQDRLRHTASKVPEVAPDVEAILESYAWFIEQTGQTTEDLIAGFADKGLRQERFNRANDYGNLMFKMLRTLARVNDPQEERLLRYLVI